MSEVQGARVGVDIGGTFTDVVVESATGRIGAKVLTTTQSPEIGFFQGISEALARAGLTPSDVGLIVHGTTLAANALIEREGASTALLTTAGHRDVLQIGTESRYDQYDLGLEKTPPLVPRGLRLPVTERIGPDGEVLVPLDEDSVVAACKRLAAVELESLAIGFLHSYRNPAHEERAAEICADYLPGLDVTLSSRVSPEMREYERISTAVANAYIRPLMRGYLERLDAGLAERGFDCPLLMMLSSGSITTVDLAREQPIRLVESGPAGGAGYAATVGKAVSADLPHTDEILAFDMGGTTAKICLIDGFSPATGRDFEVARAARHLKGSGLPLRIPVVELVEIGAGGGSIARADVLGQVAVGPKSAGSNPGPACYGRGGETPTVTDADLILGRLDPDDFAGGRIVLRKDLADTAVDKHLVDPLGLSPTDAVRAIVATIDEHMSNATRVHCLENGVEPSGRTMVVLGGAGPLHAGHIAAKLGIKRIVIPREASLGSAIGFLRAPIAFEVVRGQREELDSLRAKEVKRTLATAIEEAVAVVRQVEPHAEPAVTVAAFARYIGQGHELEVPIHRGVTPDRAARSPAVDVFRNDFEGEYRKRFGRVLPEIPIEILSWRVVASLGAAPAEPKAVIPETEDAGRASTVDSIDPDTGIHAETAVWRREDLTLKSLIQGPALIREETTTIVVPAGFAARLTGSGHLLLEEAGSVKQTEPKVMTVNA